MRKRNQTGGIQAKANMTGRPSRGVRFLDGLTDDGLTLTYDSSKDETTLRGERDGAIVPQTTFHGDIRPDGCDILQHGTGKELAGYASRLVVKLAVGMNGGAGRNRRKLYWLARQHGFRVYPMLAEDGSETDTYTLATVSAAAVSILLAHRPGVIVWIDETSVRLPGNGAVDHVAKRPRRKRGSFHPDYSRSEISNRKPARERVETILIY